MTKVPKRPSTQLLQSMILSTAEFADVAMWEQVNVERGFDASCKLRKDRNQLRVVSRPA